LGGEIVVEDEMVLWGDVSGANVEHQGNVSSMSWGVSKVDADAGTWVPTGNLAKSALEFGIKDKYWTSKRVVVVQLEAMGEGPEARLDDVRPALHGMQEACACPFGQIADALLGDPILMVGANTTKALKVVIR